MGRLFGGFSERELKTQLNLATHRFQRAIQKKLASVRQQKREIASMLAEKPYPNEEKARIRVEGLIRDDNAIEAMEILKLTCRTLDENVRLFSNHNNCPSDHLSCVSTLIWASKRFDDVPELKEIRHQFRSKFGKKFDEAAVNNLGGICNERVVGKLGSDIQTSILVQSCLENIAEEYGLDWKPKIADPLCLSPSIPTPSPVPVTQPLPPPKPLVIPIPIPHPDPPSPPPHKPGVISMKTPDPYPTSYPVKSVVESLPLDKRIEQHAGKGLPLWLHLNSSRQKHHEEGIENPEDFFEKIADLTR